MSSESFSGHTPSVELSSEPGSARQFQTVFRISPGKRQTHIYHSRRPHSKSRSGCLTCKKRRVKCDEQRPKCVRCTKKGVECSYDFELQVSCQKTDYVVSPDSTLFSLSLETLAQRIMHTLDMTSPIGQQMAPRQSLILTAFQQFVNGSTETIPIRALREKMETDMIRISFDNPHLMYTVLAVGMLHLNRFNPSKERSLAETYFWQKAINLYQRELSSNVTQENVDALLSSCMFMGVATVCPENFKTEESWVLTNRPEAMNWLCLQSGLQCILALSKPYISNSIWASAFEEVSQDEGGIFDLGGIQGREGIDPDIAAFCCFDDETTKDNNVYYTPARYLTSLMLLERNKRNAWSSIAEHVPLMISVEDDEARALDTARFRTLRGCQAYDGDDSRKRKLKKQRLRYGLNCAYY
ncbi:hypothetical protein N7468_008154 [Penicillium chermesinum]|uniref:Zn(2)-C6 fungal-type domain-containing protein n=1 Tax=Penicillium chermesinum TaxID=63820 RepID=A0A9W9NP76_9EURO|nr:uncharacterized protein N7468_008154 [Penicillium chermesinum]KAJ5223612.1 hypothetical protein N7468_008154 [Penicillium chermesinum]KAJ6155560.1 hypothetical protein N7470_006126 [Penicillium chermesinum]